jgi:hypothetical protein
MWGGGASGDAGFASAAGDGCSSDDATDAMDKQAMAMASIRQLNMMTPFGFDSLRVFSNNML